MKYFFKKRIPLSLALSLVVVSLISPLYVLGQTFTSPFPITQPTTQQVAQPAQPVAAPQAAAANGAVGTFDPNAPQFPVPYQAGNTNNAAAAPAAQIAANQNRTDAIYQLGIQPDANGNYTAAQEKQITDQMKKEADRKIEDAKIESGGGWWRWLYPGNWLPIIWKAVCNAILTLMGWLTGICGLLFNIVLQQTVVQMSTLVNILPINAAWTLLRDFANMFFIFVLLYIAIGTILKIESINTRKLVANLIMAALFINFSLFITKAVIDTSNLLAHGFYRQMPNLGTNAFQGNSGVSGTIMSSVKITSLYNTKGGPANFKNSMAKLTNDYVQFGIATIMGSIFLLILCVIFIAGAIMFIVRFVILIILMITSPLMFTAMILPQMSHLKDKWFKAFWNQIIFAPAFMLFVLISLRFLTSPGFKQISNMGDEVSFADAFANGGIATIGIIFNYLVTIAFLVASLIISKSLGHSAGGVAVGLMDKARKGAQGFAGRHTIGRVGKLAEDRLKNNKFGNSMVGRTIRENTTGAMYGAKFGSGASLESDDKLAKEIKAKGVEIQHGQTLATATKAHTELSRQFATARALPAAARTPEQAAGVAALEAHEQTIHRTMRDMTAKNIENLKGDIRKHPEVLKNMDESDFNHLMKSDMAEADKAELRNLRVKPLTDATEMPTGTPAEITARDQAVSVAVKAMSDKQVASLDASLLTNPAVVAALGDKVHTIGKDDISPGTRDLMRKARLKPLEDALASGGNVALAIQDGNFKPKEIAKMPSTVLTSTRFMDQLTPAMLTEMAGELTPGDKATIRGHIIYFGPTTTSLGKSADWLINNPAGQLF